MTASTRAIYEFIQAHPYCSNAEIRDSCQPTWKTSDMARILSSLRRYYKVIDNNSAEVFRKEDTRWFAITDEGLLAQNRIRAIERELAKLDRRRATLLEEKSSLMWKEQ